MVGVVYLTLALWATWPLARGVGDHVVDTVATQGPFGWFTLADTFLVMWALAWDVHALTTAPSSLFDANVFHPARWALARSDHFLGNLPLFAPVYLASDNPVLAHQAALLLTFAVSAFAMYVAVWTWTRSVPAAFVAGVFFGFAPWRLVQLAHLQILSALYLPLVLLSAWAVVCSGRARAWWALVGLVVLQALCSVYLALAAFTLAGAMVLGTSLVASGSSLRKGAAALGGVAVAGVVLLLLSWPYLALERLGAIPHVVASVSGTGSPLELAAAHPLRTYLLAYRPVSTDGYYFLGRCCAVLALVGLLAGGRRLAGERMPSPRAGLACALLAGWVLSLGYAWRLPGDRLVELPLAWLAHLLPGVASVRAPLRLGVVAAAAAPALAGLGYSRIEALVGGRRRRVALAVGIAALAMLEGTGSSVPLREVPTPSTVAPLYRWLATQPPGPVLELPVGFVDRDFRGDVDAARWHSAYQYASTLRWWPLLNGYSGYPPESFFFLMAIARRLPAVDALQDLVDLSGLRWLVVHRGSLRPAARTVWESAERDGAPVGLVPRASFGEDVVFEVGVPPRRDLRPLLRDEAPRDRTLGGVPRDVLAPEALSGSLTELTVPRVMLAGVVSEGAVTLRNLGTHPWPGFDADRRGLVGVAYRWRRENDVATPGALFSRVARDVMPGDVLRLPFGILSPRDPGRYELIVTLRQDGGPWFDEAAGVDTRDWVEIRPWPAGAPRG